MLPQFFQRQGTSIPEQMIRSKLRNN